MDFDRLRRNWENLGKKDPMWAILTQPGTEGGRWDEPAFFATGVDFIVWLGSWLGLYGIDITKGDALDFGCGIGRLTQALAPHFVTVTGVDISQPMVDLARQKNRHGDQVRYVCNQRKDLSVFADGSFDFVLTAIVLQHMRPEYSLRYLSEFLRLLRPGGLVFFQMATKELEAGAGVVTAVETPGEALMEIHCAPIEAIRATVTAGGGDIVREETNGWAGPKWQSYYFAVRKTAPATNR